MILAVFGLIIARRDASNDGKRSRFRVRQLLNGTTYTNSQSKGDDHALECRMNLELRKSRMVNKHSHYSLPEFLISRWKRDVD